MRKFTDSKEKGVHLSCYLELFLAIQIAVLNGFRDVIDLEVWRWMYAPFGVINALLTGVGLPPVGWLTTPAWAMPAG